MPQATLPTYEAALAGLAQQDPRVIVMTAENRAPIRNLPGQLGSRFIDVGICEQTMIGAAAGLALRGRVPVVHALAAFLTMRAFEFIRTDVGIARLPVKLVGTVAGVLSEANGPTHQALEDIALMRGIPGMQVVCPANERELVEALPQVLASKAPCYVRYNASPAPVAHQPPFELGRAARLREGTDIAILTYGALVGEALQAAHLLGDQGVAVRVVNLRSLVPFDVTEALAACRECGVVVALEDHFHVGGLHSILAEHLLKARATAQVVSIAFAERWFQPALLPDVLDNEGLSANALSKRLLQLWQSRHAPAEATSQELRKL